MSNLNTTISGIPPLPPAGEGAHGGGLPRETTAETPVPTEGHGDRAHLSRAARRALDARDGVPLADAQHARTLAERVAGAAVSAVEEAREAHTWAVLRARRLVG